MRLVDRVAQCFTPFIAVCDITGQQTRLSGASDFAAEAATCPTRYILSDELTRLCAALAFSKGAQTLAYTDLIRIPAERLWVEWAHAPWQEGLDSYGFPSGDSSGGGGRRGAIVYASRDGRRGCVRTFWCTGSSEVDVFASSLEAKFDFDALETPHQPNSTARTIRVADHYAATGSALATCFSFNFEKTWADYYGRAQLSATERQRIERHSLGTIALDIPLLLAFFLMLNTRCGLPQQPSQLERLNRARFRTGKAPLLEHIEVRAPFPYAQASSATSSSSSGRRAPRLHHVRGHLVRRRNELFWRVPHLRGNPSAGAVKSRTVTWAFDQPQRSSL